MTVFHLVRHGQTDAAEGVLSGRTPGVHLHASASAAVEAIAQRLAGQRIDRVFASPMERTQETARILAAALQLSVETSEALNEIDFGDWTGKTFVELRQTDQWASYKRLRSVTRVPGGEWALETQMRVVRFILQLRNADPDGTYILVTHGGVIRAALVYFLAMPIDHLMRLEIDVASLSSVRVDERSIQVLAVNWTSSP